MSYKIYTYTNPYRIGQTDFWDEIKFYPHLCASRTLVRGLMSVMESNEIQALYCPLDEIVQERIFSNWSKNISKRIQQYSELGKIYDRWHTIADENKRMCDNHYEAFVHNKNSMLDSIRLFIELGIKADSLDTHRLNMEHRVFVHLLKLFENDKMFSLPEMPSHKELVNLFIKQAELEKKDKLRRQKEGLLSDTESFQKDLELIDRMILNTQKWDGKHVVIHGIHQFTPLQLRLITHMDKLGMEIIFLYNYIPKYKEIYSSWNYIYQQFDAPIHHDEKIKEYKEDVQLQKPGNAIACNLALFCEENTNRVDVHIRSNYELYKDERVQEFDNISEYAGYVSDIFAEAEKKLLEKCPAREIPHQNRPSTASVLAYMSDVIYTANKDVDELLQVYHPEYARNRHFLAYPIGQFFVALYGLWNIEEKQININYGLLRECVNSGIMTGYSTEQLLKTLMNLQPLFEHISTFSEFDKKFSTYRKSYEQISKVSQGSVAFSLSTMNLYNSYKVSQKEIEDLYKAICELNENAKKLFGDMTVDEQFQFGKHFKQLKEFVSDKQMALVNEEEKDLISKLLVRLDLIQNELNDNDRKGTFDDLRSGLYFFLKQKEEPVSDWFVRNFEQIDGDVLLSRKQNVPGREKVYHFACVSDKDMNRKVDELLPWPLSEMFIERAYNPKELPFQVYYAALSERSNFLRYALFYGLYFSQCSTKISFVKRYGDDTTDYYEMFRLIGLKKVDAVSAGTMDDYPMATVVKAKKISVIKYEREQIASMFFCPYRYLLDYVLNPKPILSGSFLIQRYFINVLIENTWKTIKGRDQKFVEERLSQFVDQEAAKIDKYFPFFRKTEIIDIKKQAENYISSQILKEEQDKVREYEPTHMGFRKIFGGAEFLEDVQKLPVEHAYKEFESLAKIEDEKKKYSAHSIPKVENKPLIACALRYINESDTNLEHVGSWCTYCSDNNICLRSYAENRN